MVRYARGLLVAALVVLAAVAIGGAVASEGRGGQSVADEIAFLAPPQGAGGPAAVFGEPECVDSSSSREWGDLCGATFVDLAIAQADGAGSRWLTSEGGFLIDREWFRGLMDRPMWSPDGTTLALTRAVDDLEVWTVGRDGTAVRVAAGAMPRWSPDGASLAYTRVQGESVSIAVVGRDGTGGRVVAPSGGYPVWSPDGSRILYWDEDDAETWIVPADGSAPPRKLFDGVLAEWSPDGQRIAYWGRAANDQSSLFVADADGGNPRLLAVLGMGGFAWSPDGSRLAVVATTYDHDWAGPLYVVAVDGSGVKQIAGDVVGFPSWSPDGESIAIAKLAEPDVIVRLNRSSIYTIKPDGSGLTRITNGLFDLHPSWQPVEEPAGSPSPPPPPGPEGSGQAQVRDLGVVTPFGLSDAWEITDRGQVIGWAHTQPKEEYDLPVGKGFSWQNGKIRALRTLGGPESGAAAVNERGQIVGWANTKTKTKYGYNSHAVLWQNGKIRDLGTLGGTWSSASAINERGQIVGRAHTKTKDKDGFYDSHAFLWQNGKMRDLGTVGGPESGAIAINERGQVIGWADTKTKNKYGYNAHAFLWQNGKIRDLGTLGGPESWVAAINGRGQIVGSAETRAKSKDGDALAHAFLWQNGKMRDLGTLGGPESAAIAINERGQIIGWADTKTSRHAVLWHNGKVTDLGVLPGKNKSRATAINDRGQIVGFSYTRAGSFLLESDTIGDRAFIWENGKISDLGTLGGAGSYPYSINNNGQIVGCADTKAGRHHAVLWTLQP